MLIYVPYQLIDLPILALCLQSIHRWIKPQPQRVVVVGPALPAKLAAEVRRLEAEWMDEATIIPGRTRESMPEIPFEGHDEGRRIFSEMLSWAIGLHLPETYYAVVRPTHVFVDGVSLVEGDKAVLPTEGAIDVQSVETARRLLGACNPQCAFSRYFMTFHTALVKRLIAAIQQRWQGKRFDEAVLDSLHPGHPAFFAHDIYGWFAADAAGDRIETRPARTLELPRDLSDRHPACENLARSRQCGAVFYQPGWLEEVDAFLSQAKAFVDLSQVATVLDVGSRDGEVALSVKRRLPQVRVFAFECNPDALRLCQSNLRGHADIELVDKAVSDACGPVSFFAIDPAASVTPHLDGNIGASSLYKADHSYPYEKYAQKEITVEEITLEAWAKEARVDAVDLLWIDLQGAELRAFRGMGDLLRTVKIIYTEVEYKPMYQGQPTHQELAEFMKANGFQLRQRMNTSEWFGNEMYVRQDLLPRETPAAEAAIRVLGATSRGGRIISFGKPPGAP